MAEKTPPIKEAAEPLLKEATDQPQAAAEKTPVKAKAKTKVKRSVPSGRVYVQATYNNTVVTFTDAQGNTLTQCSAGQAGFRGPQKSTP